jgi:hypothetical protein
VGAREQFDVGAQAGRAARGAQGVAELWDGLGRGPGVGVALVNFKFYLMDPQGRYVINIVEIKKTTEQLLSEDNFK